MARLRTPQKMAEGGTTDAGPNGGRPDDGESVDDASIEEELARMNGQLAPNVANVLDEGEPPGDELLPEDVDQSLTDLLFGGPPDA